MKYLRKKRKMKYRILEEYYVDEEGKTHSKFYVQYKKWYWPCWFYEYVNFYTFEQRAWHETIEGARQTIRTYELMDLASHTKRRVVK